MIILLSPAKSLNMERTLAAPTRTQPAFPERTAALVALLKKKSVGDIKQLMGLSDTLAELNHGRYQSFVAEPSDDQAAQAIAAFDGDVYDGLSAGTMDASTLAYAQEHLRILSGLYGLLRPLDAMQPYRLEMGTKLANSQGEDLYDFWGDALAGAINNAAKEAGSSHIINLASQEYFKAARAKSLALPVLTPVFKERRDGALKQISFFAKKARGTMARWLLEQRVESADALLHFAEDGYRFDSLNEKKGEYLFVRAS